jgi:hypothetical protein
MKIFFAVLFLLVGLTSFCQTEKVIEDKLYYLITKDSMVGVQNQDKKIIIKPRPARYYNNNLTKKDCRKKIADKLIYMDNEDIDKEEPHSCGVVYNRRGELLFAPFFFDNGPDYVSEGLMRFVKNGKVGFANYESGEIIIEAKYDYAEIFNYGITSFCNGCVWNYKDEHSFVTGGKWGYLNKRGDTLNILEKPTNPKDQIIDSTKFIPYQFSYNTFEKNFIDSFYKITEIPKAYFVNHYYELDSIEKILHFEITNRPSKEFRYYQISTYSFSKRNGYYGTDRELNFYVSEDGKKFYCFEYFDTKPVPLKKWLKKYIYDAKQYSKSKPDTPNPF